MFTQVAWCWFVVLPLLALTPIVAGGLCPDTLNDTVTTKHYPLFKMYEQRISTNSSDNHTYMLCICCKSSNGTLSKQGGIFVLENGINTVLGLDDNAILKTTPGLTTFLLVYKSEESAYVLVTLECAAMATFDFLYRNENYYLFILKNPALCTPSARMNIVLIAFISLCAVAGAYMVVGTLVNRFVHHRSGWDVIPHYRTCTAAVNRHAQSIPCCRRRRLYQPFSDFTGSLRIPSSNEQSTTRSGYIMVQPPFSESADPQEPRSTYDDDDNMIEL